VRVKWLRAAIASLVAETEFIASDNPDAAMRVEISVKEGVDRLSRFPAMGRPGRVPGTRELVIPGTPYIIPYRVRRETLEVLQVFHGSRKWPKRF
jgi:toxin ParE1/3/4